jgi:hypothetical protein
MDLGQDHQSVRLGSTMKQLVPGFFTTYPTASRRTIRTPCEAKKRSVSAMNARPVPDVTSRSICSDQSAVPNDVQTCSG